MRGFPALAPDEPEIGGGDPDGLGGKYAGWGRSNRHSGLSGPLSGLDSLHSLPVSGANRG